MPEQNIRYKIEDAAAAITNDAERRNLLDFVAWLRATKLTPSWFRVCLGSHSYSYNVGYKGSGLCTLNVVFDGQRAGSWYVGFASHNHDESIVLSDKRLNKAAWDNLGFCHNCGSCMPGRPLIVCGKRFERLCISFLTFNNPKAEEIECLKKILEANITLIQSGSRATNVTGTSNPKHHAEEQSVTEPVDYIPGCLDGGMKEASLSLIEYLNENKIVPKFNKLNWWEARYKGFICKIRFPYHFQRSVFSWAVGIYLNNMEKYRDEIISEGLQDIVWGNQTLCRSCSRKCAPGNTLTVLGKEINGICVNGKPEIVWVYDPDEAAVGGIKRLLELEQQARSSKSLTR